MARTVDNLGVDVSTRYAEDQKALETYLTLVKESPLGTQAQIEVTQAAVPSELDQLFDLAKLRLPWGQFSSPPGFETQSKGRGLFTYSMLPSLGPDDKIETLMTRVQSHQISPAPTTEWQTEKASQEKIKEKDALVKLLHTITDLGKDLGEINSRRKQYQRG